MSPSELVFLIEAVHSSNPVDKIATPFVEADDWLHSRTLF